MSSGRSTMSLCEWQQLPRYTRIASVLGPRAAAQTRAHDMTSSARTVARMTEGERLDLAVAVRVKLLA